MEDTQKELERLEQELLKVDDDDALLEELIREVKGEMPPVESYLEDMVVPEIVPEVVAENAQPAFEDPDKIREPAKPMVYCNYSNGYGADLPQEETENPEQAEETARQDRLQIALMIAASVMTLGIIGILIYWMVALLG